MRENYNHIEAINKIIEEFDGKEIFYCRRSGTDGTRINFDEKNVSLCHEGEIDKPKEVHSLCNMEQFSLEVYYTKICELIRLFQNPDFACRKCSQCEKRIFHFEKLKRIIISPSTYCNSCCIYCGAHFSKKGIEVSHFDALKAFEDAGLYDSNALFDWGGGEPTLNTEFEKIVAWISRHGYKQRINTNAIEYSEATMEALRRGNTDVFISVDSGTERIFKVIKGNNNYSNVWKNISEYCRVSENVFVKYNICNLNSSKKEIKAFVDKAIDCGVKKILIDNEFHSYQNVKNAGPFYYTKNEFDAANMLLQYALDKGLSVKINGYAFGVRAEYNELGELKLPSSFVDTTDYEIISNNVFLQAVANIESMLEIAAEQGINELTIWGAGTVGREAVECLKDKIKLKIVDSNIEKQGQLLCGIPVLAPEVIRGKKANILVSVDKFESILKQINEMNLDVGAGPFWMCSGNYRLYLEDKESDCQI